MANHLQALNLTPTRLAAEGGISVGYASMILAGKRRPGPAKARELAAKTGIPAHVWRPDIFDAPANDLNGIRPPAIATLPGDVAPPDGADADAEGGIGATQSEPVIECAQCEAPANSACRNRGCPHFRKG